MLALCLSFVVVVLDQATKAAVRSHLALGDFVPVVSGLFDIRYIQNTGAAWGIFEGLNQWLVVFSLVMLVAIVAFRRHFFPGALISRIAAGLIVGGIAGNLIDRVRLNYVVDFLDFHWGVHHFPAFNVADSSICIGVGLYLIHQLTARTPAPETGTPAAPRHEEPPHRHTLCERRGE